KGAAGLKASSGTSRFHQGFFSGPLLNPIISLKPTPSKWDDAEKWITSPGHHESSSPATAASGHSHQQQLHHHHHQYHEPILTGHHLMMMPKYLSSDYNVPAQSTSFRRSIASSRVVEGAGPGSLPNFPHQQLPVNVSSVDESKSPKCAHDACDSSTKEQGSSEAPSSSFDSCTKDEFCISSSINVQIPKQGLCSVLMREIGTDPPTPPTLHTPQPSLGHRNMATQITPIESQKTSTYNQKEEKILEWEVLEKSKAETELKKTELKIEKMRMHAIEKMQSRVAAVSQKAEQMRAVAESNHIEKAAKTSAR
ncbi:unnamed protein product, partial [Sphagnum compactum]